MEAELPEVIASKIRVESSGCWLWTAATDRHGYGKIRWQRKTQFSHRVVYALLRSESIDGFDLDHLCRNVGCCNPTHLEPVSHTENLRRGEGRQATLARYAEPRDCPRGHPLYGPNLYEYRAVKNGYEYINRMCRTCRAANDRKRKARRREAAQNPAA